jgi:hypothetical protein
MLLCEYTGLTEYVRGEPILRIPEERRKSVSEEINGFDERYPFNTRYRISLQRMAENNGLDVDSYKASSYGAIKPATNKKKLERTVDRILSTIPNPASLSIAELVHLLSNDIPPHEAEKIAFELHNKLVNSLNPKFIEDYLTESDDLIFEDRTGEIFKELGFEVEMRPKPENNTRTEIEIMLKVNDKQCGLIDAKNYKTKFQLSANLASHMGAEYIPNYEGYEGREVAFFGYVTASEFSGVRNLEKISRIANRALVNHETKGIMLSASVLLGFLDYCIEENIPMNERASMFLKAVNNQAYSSIGQLLKEIRPL